MIAGAPDARLSQAQTCRPFDGLPTPRQTKNSLRKKALRLKYAAYRRPVMNRQPCRNEHTLVAYVTGLGHPSMTLVRVARTVPTQGRGPEVIRVRGALQVSHHGSSVPVIAYL